MADAPCLTRPGSYEPANLARGELAEGALRTWAGAQLARAHLAAGDPDAAADVTVRLAHTIIRQPVPHVLRLAAATRGLPDAIRAAQARRNADEVA